MVRLLLLFVYSCVSVSLVSSWWSGLCPSDKRYSNRQTIRGSSSKTDNGNSSIRGTNDDHDEEDNKIYLSTVARLA